MSITGTARRGTNMKKLFALLFLFPLVASAALPSFRMFHPDDFDTNSYIITIDPNAIVPPATSWIPGTGYEMWYEPFSGGDVSTTAGIIGALGWTEVADAGNVGITNEPGHFGVVALATTAAISQQTIFNGDSATANPTIPRLINATGWTNRVIWRLTATNSLKAHIALIGTNTTFGQAALQESIGIYLNTTNSTQIMGMVSANSVLSTTNLGTAVAAAWHTNHIWSSTAGVISFSMDGGAEATLNSNIPAGPLTPNFSVIKTEATALSHLQVDEWVVWFRRL